MGHFDPADWQREKPFTGGRNEMSFFTKFILTIALLLIGLLAYRYQAEILRFFVAPPAATTQQPVVRPQPEPTVIAPRVLVPERPSQDRLLANLEKWSIRGRGFMPRKLLFHGQDLLDKPIVFAFE